MKPTNKIERLVEKNRYKASPDSYDKTLHSFMQAVDNYNKQKSTPTKSNISKTIFKITKLAAAVVFIAVIIGLHQFSSSIKGTNIAWADVAERLENVSSYKAKARRVLTEVGQEEPFFQGDILRYFSPDHGSVEESYEDGELVMLAYCSISEKAALIVFPQNKMYCRFDLNEELLSVVEYFNPANTEGMIKLFGSERCVKLGKREIEGVATEGFEVKDVKIFSQVPRFFLNTEDINIRMWVNQETLLPTRIEGEGFFTGLMALFMNCRYQEVMHSIEYDVEIDESIFDPNIPDDYILIDPANVADKAKFVMLGILPFGAAIITYKHRKKKRLNISDIADRTSQITNG
jgi:outer membrane lipoprotein-sorting protein